MERLLCRVLSNNIPIIIDEQRPPHLEGQIANSEGIEYSETDYPGCHVAVTSAPGQ
jgi:hypothetical protein